MAQRILIPVSGVAQTTDAATAVTVASFDLSSTAFGAAWNNCVVSARAHVCGRQSTNSAVGQLMAGFSRNSGTLAQIGSAVAIGSLLADAALATVAVNIDSSGNLIRLRVNGVVATTIDWGGWMELWIVQP
jgi:hypothetical protein